MLGAPGLVLVKMSEFAEQIRRIARATDLSLLVDADHGYGNALNVMRPVEEMEAACRLGMRDHRINWQLNNMESG